MKLQRNLGLTAVLMLILILAACSVSESPELESDLTGQATGALIWPVSGPVTSNIGPRGGRPHKGIDIGVPIDTPVYAAYDGTIICDCYQAGLAGNYLKIQHSSGYETLYMHLDSFVRRSGTVKKGELIGRSGNTGRSTGPHLHFEVRRNGTYIDWDAKYPKRRTRVTAKTPIGYNFRGLSAAGDRIYSRYVFDWNYYLSRHSDLRRAGINTEAEARAHWRDRGIREGRRATPMFSTKFYLKRYPDLRKAFGAKGYTKALNHYLDTRLSEARTGTEVNIYDRRVFNWRYYLDKHPDLGQRNVDTEIEARRHWRDYGIKEGRRGSRGFHSTIYYNRYADLRRVFKSEYKNYGLIKHYLDYGIREGRDGN